MLKIMRQWLLYMFLIVSSGVSLHNCIEVITSERNERPQPDAHFLIPGLNLSSLGTHSNPIVRQTCFGILALAVVDFL